MKVIVRKTGIELIFFSLFFISIGVFILYYFRFYELDFFMIGEIFNDISLLITFVILLGLSISLIVFGVRNLYKELKKSRKIISYNKATNELYLHSEGINLHVSNINEIKYIKDPSPKGFSREKLSGTLTVCTTIKNYEFNDVSSVEIAADILENIVYDYYHKDTEN